MWKNKVTNNKKQTNKYISLHSQGTSGDSDREIVFNIDPEMQRPTADSKYDNHSLIFNVSIHAAIRRGDMKLVTGYQGKITVITS